MNHLLILKLNNFVLMNADWFLLIQNQKKKQEQKNQKYVNFVNKNFIKEIMNYQTDSKNEDSVVLNVEENIV